MSTKTENGLNEIPLNFRPFEVPGTLHSNLTRLEGINPYFEKEIERFNSLENDCLILIHQLPKLDKSKEFYLEFDWIDTNADIFLGGKQIGSSANAFLKKKITIPKSRSTSLLTLILYPHMSYINEGSYDFPPIKNPIDRVFVRRPTYNYGWDFSPRALLIGIGSVKIIEKNDITIETIFVHTEEISKNDATINVEWSVQSMITGKVDFSLELLFKETNETIYKEIIISKLEKGNSHIKSKINLPQAKLWWPNGYGKQNLYTLKIIAVTHEVLNETTFGIRKIELLLQDTQRQTFIFKINDTKIWAKGANWVPTDSLLNYSHYKKYQTLLLLAKNANFNMIRIWGGGVVEKEEFYNLCDELGLLIWHDFQFACSVYPQTEEYLKNVNNEVRGIIKRLRGHPSIVLWNGNNENEWIDFQHYAQSYREEKGIGEKLHKLKMRACKELDPSRPYWRSSPWSPSSENSFDFDPNSPFEGNRHNWEVWHGVDQPELLPPEYEHYYNEKGIFISEFGIQSLPIQETIDEIFSSDNRKNYNEIWEFHNCDIDKIKVNMAKFGEPRTISDYIIYSQAAQAFGLKYAIDTWRGRKWKMTGALIWQFNEPWPTICWSLIDYYNRPKIAYWFVKRAFNVILPVFSDKENAVSIINDTLFQIQGQLEIQEYKLPGHLINKVLFELTIKANDTSSIEYTPSPEAEIIFLTFDSPKGKITNYYLMTDVVNLQIPNPEIHIEYSAKRKKLILKSDEFAFIVKLDESLELKENYIVILPNVPYELDYDKNPKISDCKITIWDHPEKIVKMGYQST